MGWVSIDPFHSLGSPAVVADVVPASSLEFGNGRRCRGDRLHLRAPNDAKDEFHLRGRDPRASEMARMTPAWSSSLPDRIESSLAHNSHRRSTGAETDLFNRMRMKQLLNDLSRSCSCRSPRPRYPHCQQAPAAEAEKQQADDQPLGPAPCEFAEAPDQADAARLPRRGENADCG